MRNAKIPFNMYWREAPVWEATQVTLSSSCILKALFLSWSLLYPLSLDHLHPLGYLYHDFTDEEAEDQRWGKLARCCWETLFILSPLRESQSTLADSSLPEDLSLILFPNPACLRVCQTDWLVKESLLFKLHLSHQSYSIPIVPTYYQTLYVGPHVL